MSVTNIVLYAIAAFACMLGVLVFLRNSQSKSHRYFLGLSLSVASWIMTNALFTQASGTAAYVIALVAYACAAATAVAFFFFVTDLSGVVPKRQRLIAWVSVIFISVSAVPNVLATGVVDKAITTTPLILGYALGLVALFGGGIWTLFKSRRRNRGQRRQQINTVLLGLLGGIVGGVIFNLVLPIQGDYRFVELGPVFSMLFVVASAYAIVRHRLFDVRAAIVRVAAYSLAILTIASLYVVAAYIVALLFFGATPSGAQWPYIVLAVLAALTFPYVKKFFDAATLAIFYKNAYRPQEVLDHLGDVLVSEVDVTRLLQKSMGLLTDAVRPSGTEVFLVNGKQQVRAAVFGKPLTQAGEVSLALHSRHATFVVTDDLAEQGGALYNELTTAGVAIFAPLITSHVTVGYLLIGYKASGDAFTRQDIDLVRIFADELAVAVQNALRFEEISRFNVTLKEEVSDATSQLRASNRKLHQLDQAKDEFISMASHQLRTPLTSVKGYLSMVLEGDAGKITEDQRKLLDEAYSSSQRMVYLIGDFLNVSRLQTGKFELDVAPLDLAGLVQEEVEQLQATAARRDITLVFHKPTQFPDVPLDEGKIRQVIMNFVDNAIFYSRPNSAVTLELTATSREASLAVHDTGIGVPQSERHHLFTKFYRATNARQVRPDGTGIGLYMAKKVITAHGGSIIFETKENRGSTFGFRVPLKNQVK